MIGFRMAFSGCRDCVSGEEAVQHILVQPPRVAIGARMISSLFSRRWPRLAGIIATLVLLGQSAAFAAPAEQAGGEANLKLPDLSQVQFLGGIDGHSLLMYGPLACVLGMLFGFFMYVHLKGLPVHRAMKEVSQLIWETCCWISTTPSISAGGGSWRRRRRPAEIGARCAISTSSPA